MKRRIQSLERFTLLVLLVLGFSSILRAERITNYDYAGTYVDRFNSSPSFRLTNGGKSGSIISFTIFSGKLIMRNFDSNSSSVGRPIIGNVVDVDKNISEFTPLNLGDVIGESSSWVPSAGYPDFPIVTSSTNTNLHGADTYIGFEIHDYLEYIGDGNYDRVDTLYAYAHLQVSADGSSFIIQEIVYESEVLTALTIQESNPILSYGNGKEFHESVYDNGMIADSIEIKLIYDSFDEIKTLEENTDYYVVDLPDGLTPRIEVRSSDRAVLFLDGIASNNLTTDVTDFNLVFYSDAFSSGDVNAIIGYDVIIDLFYKEHSIVNSELTEPIKIYSGNNQEVYFGITNNSPGLRGFETLFFEYTDDKLQISTFGVNTSLVDDQDYHLNQYAEDVKLDQTINWISTTNRNEFDDTWGGRTGFIGIQLKDLSNNLFNGWVKVKVNQSLDTLEILDWAYIDKPESRIFTGQITIEKVTSLSVRSENDVVNTSVGNTIQLFADVMPINANDNSVSWSIVSGDSYGSIDENGLFTALETGSVQVQAVSNDGSRVTNTFDILVKNVVQTISLSTPNAETSVEVGESIQINSTVFPADAVNTTVTWSIVSGANYATLSGAGLLTGTASGTVELRATANDGSNVMGDLSIEIIQVVQSISIATPNAETSINVGESIQIAAAILPADASDNTVTWSVVSGSNYATLSDEGVLTATALGVVELRATANDGSNVMGDLTIEIIQVVQSISIATPNAETSINVGESIQIAAAILPADASDNTVTWSVVSGSNYATLSDAGLLTGTASGTVELRATANDGSNVMGDLSIEIIQVVQSISIATPNAETSINVGESIQIAAAILPADASDNSVVWSIVSGSNYATLSDAGLLTGTASGTVELRATANDGSNVMGDLSIEIIQVVQSISVATPNAETSINVGESIQIAAAILPADASDNSVVWSIVSGSNYATLSDAGLLTGTASGTVELRATANDGSNVMGDISLNVLQLVETITLTHNGAGLDLVIGDVLQLSAEVLPTDASNNEVTWSIESGSNYATLSNDGTLTATASGTVLVRAIANDGSTVMNELTFTISTPAGVHSTLANDIEVYPNPFQANLTIRSKEDAVIQIIDVVGKSVKYLKTATEFQVNTTEFENGVYFISISTKEGQTIQKIIKK